MDSSLKYITDIEDNTGEIIDYRRKNLFKKKSLLIDDQIRKGIWVYFFLLIFEGGLRKWILPGLSTPLLIIRDPVAIWLLYMAWKNNKLHFNVYTKGIYIITGIAIITALLFGHGSLIVALYGARIFLFHFPLIFLIGQFFNREDVIKIGKVTLWISLPMLLLIAIQFYSPQSSFVNRGVGGDLEGAGFSGALGFYRPPATFSFTTGNAAFWGIVTMFVIYFWLDPKKINRFLLIASTVCLVAAVPLSISRTVIFQIVLSLGFTAVIVAGNPKYIGRMILAAIGFFIILTLLNNISFFSKATEALTSRFTDANENEGGVQGTLVDRFLGGLLGAIESSDQPFFGYGIGMGTNAGAKLLRGDVVFLIAEEEWGRLVGEMGTILGLSVIFIRSQLCIVLLQKSFAKVRGGDVLPWMLISVAFLSVAQGQWAQPTALGFGVMTGGLVIACLKDGKLNKSDYF